MTLYRPAAIAGSFYPASQKEIQQQLSAWLQKNDSQPIPKAAIVPHAGWRFSGECAAKSYNHFYDRCAHIEQILLFGPAHKVGFEGVGLSSAQFWQTPEGVYPLDTDCAHHIMATEPKAQFIDIAHAHEHCLEVQVPFIRRCFPNAKLTPILVSKDGRAIASRLIKKYLGQDNMVILISSDLSHYNAPDYCRQFDDETASLIEQYDINALHGKRACGYQAIQALLDNVKDSNYTLQREHLCHSGDAMPGADKVVGYGAWTLR